MTDSVGGGRGPASLLRRLSDQFEFCVYGLGVVRREVRAYSMDTLRNRPPTWS